VNSADSTSSVLDHGSDTRPGTLALFTTLVRFVTVRAKEKFTHRVARLAMRRLRKDPAKLRRALQQARQVLIVCHGNIIRSAFAAQLLQQLLGARRRVRIASAGLEATPGRPPHPNALRLARRLHIDLSRHAASRVSLDDIRASDVVFAVDVPQFAALRTRFPAASDKMFPLTCLAPSTPLEIADPINGDDRAFEVCFAHIIRAIDPIRRAIVGSATSR